MDRKLVKQTVMTSVYGVTYVGAREQIKRRLEEKGVITDERMLFAAACYSAEVRKKRVTSFTRIIFFFLVVCLFYAMNIYPQVTLAALGEIFEAARAIMSWLGDCAKVVQSCNLLLTLKFYVGGWEA